MRLYLVKGASFLFREDFKRQLVAPRENWLQALNSPCNREAIFVSKISDADPNQESLRAALLKPDPFLEILPFISKNLSSPYDVVNVVRDESLRKPCGDMPDHNGIVDLSNLYTRFLQQRRAAMLGRICDMNARSSINHYFRTKHGLRTARQNTMFLSYGINCFLSDLAYNGRIPECRYEFNGTRYSLMPLLQAGIADGRDKTVNEISSYLHCFNIKHEVMLCDQDGSVKSPKIQDEIYLSDDTDLIRLIDKIYGLGLGVAMPIFEPKISRPKNIP